MDIRAHTQFKQQFTEEKYQAFLRRLNTQYNCSVDFRVCESPLFMSDTLRDALVAACSEITTQLQTPEFTQHARSALPAHFACPGEGPRPDFLQIDFGICEDGKGGWIPQLIELQAFASMYMYQWMLEREMRSYAQVSDEWQTYFHGLNEDSYVAALKQQIVAGCKPEEVILLEIEPEKQYTKIDFAITEALLGVRAVCLTKVQREGRHLFYMRDGKKTSIQRIYNRVIPDEYLSRKLPWGFDLRDEINAEWVGHPNWFFRISKHTLPFLKSRYVPECHFLSDLKTVPEELSRYVLKPLFSFAGLGVEIDVTAEKIAAITKPEEYLLQKKVQYAPLVPTLDEPSKVEVRMMFLWGEKPKLINNLARFSKGKMVGVSYNKDRTWVGSSVGYHR